MGETLGKASDLYLQNKIQGYFDKEKEDRQKDLLGKEQVKSGTAIAELLGTPEKAKYFSQLPVSMQQSLISPMMQSKGIGNITSPDYTSQFSNIESPTNSAQQQPVKTTTETPGVPREQQARESQNEAYKNEAEQINPENQTGQQLQQNEPSTLDEKLKNDWVNKQNAIDQRHNDLLQQHPEQAEAINKAYTEATKINKDKSDQLRKLSENQINRENEEIKDKDLSTKAAITKVNEKAENAKTILSRLDDLDKLIDQGGIGYSAGSIARGLTFGLANGEALDTLSGAAPIRAAYDEIAKMNLEVFKGSLAKGISNQAEFKEYSHVISNASDPPSVARAKNDALRKVLERDVKKKEIYDSIKNPDGTYPKNASKLIDQLTKESDSQVKKEVGNVIKNTTPTKGNIYMVSPDGTLGEVPANKVEEALSMGYKRQ
jgi:hypothetical protein